MTDTGIRRPMGIVVPYWNALGDVRRHRNIRRCLAALRRLDEVRVLCVELDGPNPSGVADVVLRGAPESAWLWQKERLVNHGFRLLMEEGFEHLGYVDSDCLFEDDGWIGRVAERLEAGANVIQAFARVREDGRVSPASLTAWPRVGPHYQGGSMFFDAALLQAWGGLYEHCIVGGGDFVVAMAATGDRSGIGMVFRSPGFMADGRAWLDRARSVEVRCASADNGIDLLPHGNSRRVYGLRHALLADFDPAADLVPGEVLGLSESGMRLLPGLRAYVTHRETPFDSLKHG